MHSSSCAQGIELALSAIVILVVGIVLFEISIVTLVVGIVLFETSIVLGQFIYDWDNTIEH